MIERRREHNLETHIAFINIEKTFDSVNRELLWDILHKRGYPKHLIKVIQSMYQGTNIIIQTDKQKTKHTINQGVRQGCSLSPNLFNIYVDDLVRIWKDEILTGIKIGQEQCLNVLLFADDLVIIQNDETKLQKAVYEFYKLSQIYNFKISKTKTKMMAFHGKFPIRTKIVIDNYILEQVSHFNYLGMDIRPYI